MKRCLLAGLVCLSVTVAPAAGAAPTAPTPSPSKPPPARHFANCKQACAAGVAPMHRGDPNYDPRLDRDNDGIACEKCP